MIKKIKASIENFEIRLPKMDLSRNKIGIQIGEKSIKIVETTKSGAHWETKQSIIEELPVGMVLEGRVLQPELLGLKIKELFLKHGISTKKVSVFLEELPVFVRTVRLPKMVKKERDKAIHYHAQLDIPVNLSELTIRYSLVQSHHGDEEQNEYIVFAVYSSLIEKVVQAIEVAGLSLYNLGLEPDAIYEGLKEKKIIQETKDSIMIVRTDTQRMLLAIYNNEKLVYSRYVPFSLDRSDWEQEIQRTLVSWNGKNKSNRIKDVLLLGEKDHWDAVKKRIEDFMPLSVHLVASPFTACLGMSLKGPDEHSFYTDKPALSTSKLSVTAKVLIPVGTIAVIVFAYIITRPFFLQNEIDSLQDKIVQQREISELVQEEETLKRENQTLLMMEETIKGYNIDILDMISTITAHQPKDIQLTQMTFSGETINLSGVGTTQETVVAFFKELQKNPQFPNAQLSHSAAGQDNVQFSIDVNKNEISEGEDGAETE